MFGRRGALWTAWCACARGPGDYDCDFLQWHSKGALPGQVAGSALHRHVVDSCAVLSDQQLIQSVLASHPDIAHALPFGDEELDAEGGWSTRQGWPREQNVLE